MGLEDGREVTDAFGFRVGCSVLYQRINKGQHSASKTYVAAKGG